MPALAGVIGAALIVALVLIPPLPWNMRIPLYLLTLIWTILRPRLALYLMAFAVPWGSLDFLNVAGLRLNSADILVVFLAIGWLLSWTLATHIMDGGRDREHGKIPAYLIVSILLLIGVMLLSTSVAISKRESLKEIARWLEFIVLLLLGTQYLRTRRQIWTLVIFMIAATITQAFLGYAQALWSLGPTSFVRSFNLRVYGTFEQPNPYAGYLNMSLAIVLSLLLLGRSRLTRVLAGIASCLIGGALYLAQSRGGQVALVAALLFILLTSLPALHAWSKIAIVGVLALVEGMVIGIIPFYFLHQANHFLGLTGISLLNPSSENYSTAERLAHWIAGINMYASHPLLGVGIGNYAEAYPHYAVTIFANPLGQAHNYYINIAAETGTIGLAIYLFFVASMLIAGGKAVQQVCTGRRQILQGSPQAQERTAEPQNKSALGRLTNDRALAIGLLAALITICVHNLVDDLYDHSLTNLMALLLCALICLGRITSDAPQGSSRASV